MHILNNLAMATTVWACALGLAIAGDKPAKTVIVAVDLSSSTIAHRDDYLKYFRTILDTMDGGDNLMVLKISDRPASGESVAIGPISYKTIDLTKSARKVKGQNMDDSLKALRVFESLVATNQAAKPNEGETPIIEITRDSVRLFELYKAERKILVYLSDMLESSRVTANFESLKPPFNQKSAEEIFKKVKREGRIAKLDGVRIYVAGARALNTDNNPVVAAARSEAAKWFWTSYFTDAGAKMNESAYARDLLRFHEIECNTSSGCSNGFFATERDKRTTK